MDVLSEFLDGHIAILLDKDNRKEISEVISIIKPVISDEVANSCYGNYKEALYLKETGPVHWIDCERLNGCSEYYYHLHRRTPTGEIIELMTAKDFIAAATTYTPPVITESDFYSLIGV